MSVIVTANVSDHDRKVCHDAGMTVFIPKPVTVQQLAEYLERYLTTTQSSQLEPTSTITITTTTTTNTMCQLANG